jgi:hypothetical protein
MTIQDLKRAIQDLPNEMEVYMDRRLTEERYGLVNSVTIDPVYLEGREDQETFALILKEE